MRTSTFLPLLLGALAGLTGSSAYVTPWPQVALRILGPVIEKLGFPAHDNSRIVQTTNSLGPTTSFAQAIDKPSGPHIFRGTSLIFSQPRDRKGRLEEGAPGLNTAAFYCYFDEKVGYVSFGWFMGGDPNSINGDDVNPEGEGHGWFEWTTSIDCDKAATHCKVHTINVLAGDEDGKHFLDHDYVIVRFDLNSHSGMRSLDGLLDSKKTQLRMRPEDLGFYASYLTHPWGFMGAGVRHLVAKDECQRALTTLKRLSQPHPLSFELDDKVCDSAPAA
ncbi:hypothetical protein CF327_g5140 [Tilletia walkeri]|uniref:Uncharacterized protein n=1 Tax=Tilletia walkeri TaxID=117179 RepID=A0A8X7T4R4_9BASI|nr:hypothetical protein CF327_g5140 [Tilletia walkeri]KAE8267618.1 hypothetical protein A4X09_0g4728 [Tilletia walkeri]